jgi:hypothetical protein
MDYPKIEAGTRQSEAKVMAGKSLYALAIIHARFKRHEEINDNVCPDVVATL